MPFRALAALLLAASAVIAQTQTATLRGVINDRSLAIVPNAVVTLTNVDQNREWHVTSNAEGDYVFVQIPPGNYSLSVEAKGFKKYERTGLTLEVAQVSALDIALDLGAVTEVVEVKSQAPLLETASSTLGEVVNGKSTEALPLNGRNILQLVAMTPGINTSRSARGATSGSGSIASMAFSANGGRDVSNEVMLDGSPQVVMGYNQPAYVPTPDALQEFRVQTNSLSAEYGRTGGAVVNLVHRSGTKEFHGVLYEFLRNDKFDSNTFFSNRNGQAKPPFRYNQFGFTIGGPLTPSRQSTFFFLNFESVRQVSPGSSTFTVPTAAMRAGDFSATGVAIYDPNTIDANGVRQPFPGNIIPAGRINPIAAKIVGYYPAPTVPGLANNFFSQQGSPSLTNNFSVKIDRKISDRQNLYGRFSWLDSDTNPSNYYANIASPESGWSGGRSRSVTLDDTYLLGGWVLHANAGYAYAANPRAGAGSFDVGSLGLPASFVQQVQFPLFPRIEPAGYGALGDDPTWVIGNKFETYTGIADATRLLGGHTIKFGGVYRQNRVSNFRPNSPAGYFTFDEGFTRQTFNGNTGGNSIAAMLLGLVGNANGGRIQYEPQLALEVLYGGAYFQDDWRVSKRLTVNLGLRWDTDRPLTERFNRTSWFDFQAPLPVQVPGFGTLHGGLVFAGRNGEPRGNKNPDNRDFAPRVGLAYKLSDRLVARAGFGIFFSPTTGIGPSAGSIGAYSFDAVTNVVTSIDGGRTPFTSLSNPFPQGYNVPSNGADGLLTLIGQAINAQVRTDRVPYTAQWNLDLQYELPDQMLVEAAYAGNAGIRLLAQNQLDQLPDQYMALGDGLTRTVANPFFGIIPTTSSIGQPTTTQAQLLRPYPQLTGLQQTWGSLAHSSYHSMQLKFRKRYRSGLQMLAAYTWAKMLDDFSSVGGYGQTYPGYTDFNNRRLDKSLSSLDVAHHLVVNYEYDLPFKPSQRLLRAVAGGWSLNGVTTLQSGMPISILSVANTTNSLGGVQRPNRTGLPSATSGSDKDRVNQWFNTAAFVNVPKYTFGNVSRTLPDNRGPKLVVWDFSVLKNIPIRESKRLEFRAEFFNMLNNVNFLPPEGQQADFGRPQFGTLVDTERARVIQFALKLHY